MDNIYSYLTNKQPQTLDLNDENHIKQKVRYHLLDSQYKVINVGVISQIITGLILSIVLYGQISAKLLVSWYVSLLLINLVTYIFFLKYIKAKPTYNEIDSWQNVYIIIVSIMVSIWGSCGFLLMPSSITYQFLIIAFLFVLSSGFAQGTLTDLLICRISIFALLLPMSVWCFLQGKLIYSGMGITFLIYMFFLFTLTKKINNVINESLELRFKNDILNEKLGKSNETLEQKVEERTAELKQSLDLVTYQASHDLLTDLSNQLSLHQHIEEKLQAINDKNSHLIVLFFGIDRFKYVNDSLSHKIGDSLLVAVAKRLQSEVQSKAKILEYFKDFMIARMWGDMFVVTLLTEDKALVEKIISDISKILDEPFNIENQEFNLTSSIGVSISPEHGRDANSLLTNAEAAMFSAKKAGGNNLVLYTPELNANASDTLELENHLRRSIENYELITYYQPLVNLKTGEICGAEALVRWMHPSKGMIQPINFITLAEEIGFIIPLGGWVLKTACQQAKAWHDMGYDTLKIAVNLSIRQFRQKDLVEVIKHILEETGLPPQFLELEITESMMMENTKEIIKTLHRLKDLGLSLSIDDFGTGYSSLSYLRELPVSKLKIDKSFVQDIAIVPDDEAIVLTIISMAKNLNLQTLAEGVETAGQLKFLIDHDCDMLQGYYFSKPVDADSFTQLLKAGRRLD